MTHDPDVRWRWLSARLLVGLALVLAAVAFGAGVQAQDGDDGGGGDEEPPPLRLPAPVGERKLALTDHEIVRNGTFSFAEGAWALSGGMKWVGDKAGRTGRADDAGANISVTNALGADGGLLHELLLPTVTKKMTVRFDYRLIAEFENPQLGGFAAAIGQYVGANFRELVPLVGITPANYPGPDWQRAEVTVTAQQLANLNGVHAANGHVVLLMRVRGNGVALQVDNVSAVITGEQTIPETPGVIACAVQPASGPFTIDILRADNFRRRTVYRSPRANTGCADIAWRPDGEALTFSSDCELGYSAFTNDLYTTDGRNEQRAERLTNAPGRYWINRQFAAARLPATGSVTVKVRNTFDEQVTQVGVYVQGARAPKFVSLAPAGASGDVATVTIPDVIDLGDVGQTVSARITRRSVIAANTVDIKPGETVELVGEILIGNQMVDFHISSPTWHRGGRQLACAIGGLKTLPADGGVPTTEVFGNMMGYSPAWSPVDDRLVFLSANAGIWMMSPGDEKATQLVEHGNLFTRDPAWLPDGTGILFARDTSNALYGGRNICVYGFANQQAAVLTDVINEQLGSPTSSPDGRFIAFTRTLPTGVAGREHTELWVMEAKRPTNAWRVPVNGQPSAPVWSPR